MKVLHICADPKPTEESTSKQIAAAFFGKLLEMQPEADLTHVDLYSNPPPYLSHEAYRGMWTPVLVNGYNPIDTERAAMEYGRQQAELFNQSDVVVLTIPMWTFSIPGILKSWLDHVIAPGHTYTFAPTGARPLHHVKRIVSFVASGFAFKEDDPRDVITPQLRVVFNYIGINDLSMAWADGQFANIYKDADERKQMALEAAQDLAQELAEELTSV